MDKTLKASVKIFCVLVLVAFLMPQAGSVSFAQDKKAKIVRTLVGTVNAGGAFPGPLPAYDCGFVCRCCRFLDSLSVSDASI